MAFDTATRNELQKMVGRARDRLVEEFTSQCQGDYGIQPDGTAFDLSTLAHSPEAEQTRARLLRDRVDHLAAGLAGPRRRTEAVTRLVREQAFTVLNRLCALRLCEERGAGAGLRARRHLRPPVLGKLIAEVFQQMRLAGEAGSLLRIEDAIRSAVEAARSQWLAEPPPKQLNLFPDLIPGLGQPEPQQLRFDLSGISAAGSSTWWS